MNLVDLKHVMKELLVRAGSLNFRDVMLAYGKLSKDLMSHGHGGHQIGLEFSGKVKIATFRRPFAI
jgi:fatty acid synthase